MKMQKWIALGLFLVSLQGTVCLAQAVAAGATVEVPQPAVMAPGVHTARPQVGALLKAAQAFNQQKKPRLALEKLSQIDAMGDLTASESFLQARVRAAAAAMGGDDEAAILAFRALIATPFLTSQEKLVFERGLAGLYLRSRQYARLIESMSADIQAGGDPQLHKYLVQAYVESEDLQKASLIQGAFLRSPAGADDARDVGEWKLLAYICNLSNDQQCYVDALESVASLKYSADIVRDVLNRMTGEGNPGDRMMVEILRLKQKVTPLSAADLLHFSRLLLMDGAPIEASVLVEKAFKSGVLGTGADAPRHGKLRAIVAREYALSMAQLETAPDHFKNARQFDKVAGLGYDLVHAGQAARGIALIELAIASGALRDINIARLHLGFAYAAAGRHEEAAAQMNSIPPEDGLAQLGRFWMIQSKQPISRPVPAAPGSRVRP